MNIMCRWVVPVLAAAAGFSLGVAGACGAAEAAGVSSPAVPGVPGSAQAAMVSNHKIPGHESAISCLTASRCVAVGYEDHRGQVVVLINGKKAAVSRVRAGSLVAVSCPSRFGCWALGLRKGGLSFVELGRYGTITRQIAVTGRAVAAAGLNQISCGSMTSCELVDNQYYRQPVGSVQLGSWNGRKLRLTPDSDDGTFYLLEVGGISCWKTTCVTVGTTISDSTDNYSFIVTIRHGKPAAVDFAPANEWGLHAVSCVSSSTCYAVGAYGIFATVINGDYGTVENGPAGNHEIECAGSTCWTTRRGILWKVTNGAIGPPITDSATPDFTGIARRGTGFAAIGETTSGTATVVATG